MSWPLHSELRALARGRPGHRFQARYEQARRKRAEATITGRIVRLTLAAIALAIGVVLVFIPGPAILFFFIAAGLLAGESRGVARLLDRGELMLRALGQWALRRWCGLPIAGQVLVAVAGVALASGFVYFTWRVMFR